jgi:hypothetical protein
MIIFNKYENIMYKYSCANEDYEKTQILYDSFCEIDALNKNYIFAYIYNMNKTQKKIFNYWKEML